MLLLVLMMEEETAAVTAWGLMLHRLLHLNQSLLSCSVIDNHRAACVGIVHTKFVSQIFRPGLTQTLVVVSGSLGAFSLNSAKSFNFSLVIIMLAT